MTAYCDFITHQVLTHPSPQTISHMHFHHNTNSRKCSFSLNFIPDYDIALRFCTCQDCTAVVPYAIFLAMGMLELECEETKFSNIFEWDRKKNIVKWTPESKWRRNRRVFSCVVPFHWATFYFPGNTHNWHQEVTRCRKKIWGIFSELRICFLINICNTKL